MKGLMGTQPLTVRTVFDRMRTVHADGEVVDALPTGSTRTTYGQLAERVLRLVTVLRELGVQPGDRVGTFANNSSRHVELYYAVPLAGAVLHMVNIRLHDDQLEHVVADAGDTLLFVDDDLVPRLAPLVPRLSSVRTYVRLGKGDTTGIDGMLDGEGLLADAAPTALEDLPELAEDDACGMCHTSGTTGMPKAVVYSHRSTYLHAMAACAVDGLALSEAERVLPVVPLFHACGWGLPYAAPLTGAELVLAGADTSPAHLARVVESERVTWAAGVPTIWTSLLPLAQSGGADLSSLRTIGIGGSATPLALLEAYDALGVEIVQIWGMTETSPVAAASRPRRRHRGLDADELRTVRAKTGTVFAGLEARVVGEDGEARPWDGESVGELECRGPWVCTDYWGGAPERFHDGWLRTGDMAVMESDGYFRIVDRSKDLVKSGGEWISSVELEGHVLAHPAVREAAVVGVPSARWDERPAVVAALHDGASLDLAGAARASSTGASRAGGCPTSCTSSTRCRGRASASTTRRRRDCWSERTCAREAPAARTAAGGAARPVGAGRRRSGADAAAGAGGGALRPRRPGREGRGVGLARRRFRRRPQGRPAHARARRLRARQQRRRCRLVPRARRLPRRRLVRPGAVGAVLQRARRLERHRADAHANPSATREHSAMGNDATTYVTENDVNVPDLYRLPGRGAGATRAASSSSSSGTRSASRSPARRCGCTRSCARTSSPSSASPAATTARPSARPARRATSCRCDEIAAGTPWLARLNAARGDVRPGAAG